MAIYALGQAAAIELMHKVIEPRVTGGEGLWRGCGGVLLTAVHTHIPANRPCLLAVGLPVMFMVEACEFRGVG